ncbi:MAG TPA: exosortase [Steroidobacteraceae bacterium]|nr:exosortase [Steroidobacteraceae bacterium]
MNLLVVFIVAAALWPTSLALHQRWTEWDETTYTHGWLIAAVVVFLLWRNRNAANAPAPRISPAALATLFGVGLLWAFGVRAGLVFIEWLLLPVLMWLAVWAATGAASARRNLFAVAFLYFAVPLWGAVNDLFLWMTVLVVRALLRVTGIPAHFDGNLVQVPAGVFEIAGGCSGLHFVMVALALGALMGELRGDDWRGRLKLLVLAGALAVVTNWIRVFSLIVVGHYSDMQHYLVAVSHYTYGWVLFAIAMVGFFLLERRMASPAAQPDAGAAPGPTAAPASARALPALAVAVVMALVALLQALSARPAAAAPATQATPADSTEEGWQPVVDGADSHTASSIDAPGGPIERRHYIFLSQHQGKEIGGYAEDPTGGDQLLSSRQSLISGIPLTLYETRDSGGEIWLVAVTYRVGSNHYATSLPAKVSYAAGSLLQLRSMPAAITVWRTRCIPDCPAAESALGAVIAATEMED